MSLLKRYGQRKRCVSPESLLGKGVGLFCGGRIRSRCGLDVPVQIKIATPHEGHEGVAESGRSDCGSRQCSSEPWVRRSDLAERPASPSGSRSGLCARIITPGCGYKRGYITRSYRGSSARRAHPLRSWRRTTTSHCNHFPPYVEDSRIADKRVTI